MTIKNNFEISLDKFIDFALYDKKKGYYMKKNPFGQRGDFVTAPNISRLFSEMVAIWVVSFWQNLGSPKKFNLIELGAGNGRMMKVMIESFQNFPIFYNACNFIIHEKSPFLIKIQKKELIKNKIEWVSDINKIKKLPSIFVANEFFDALAVKHFKKKNNLWFEKFVNLKQFKKAFFFEKKIDIKKIEKRLHFEISKNQNFIEFSELGFNYLKKICKVITKSNGGLLIIDYGFTGEKMKNTLQAISNHKFANILKNIGNTDITHNINFSLFKKFTKQFDKLDNHLTYQKNFLLKMGIEDRAEIISKKLDFSEKADMYYRLKRLIDKKQMGKLFKVMLIKNKKSKFRLGF